MTTTAAILTAIPFSFFLLSLYMLWRNQRVYNIRQAILDIEPITEGLDLYRHLPDYHAMMYNFRKPLTYKYWLQYVMDKRNNNGK